MFLARTVAHTVDVDAMLESMEPKQFDEWAAMYAVRPWGIEPEMKTKQQGDSLSTFKGLAGL